MECVRILESNVENRLNFHSVVMHVENTTPHRDDVRRFSVSQVVSTYALLE